MYVCKRPTSPNQGGGSWIAGICWKSCWWVGRRFPFHFPEAVKLEVETCLVLEAARDTGDPEKPCGVPRGGQQRVGPWLYIQSPGKTLGFPQKNVLRCEDQPRHEAAWSLRPSWRANMGAHSCAAPQSTALSGTGGCGLSRGSVLTHVPPREADGAPLPPWESAGGTDGTDPVTDAAEHGPRRGPGQCRTGAGFCFGADTQGCPAEGFPPAADGGDTKFSLIFPDFQRETRHPHHSQTTPRCSTL